MYTGKQVTGTDQRVASSVLLALRPLPGAVLLFAGLLKLLTGGELNTSIGGAAEALLGLWLLAEFWWQMASRVAAGVYLLFSVVNVWALVQGHDSCGCLGGVQVPPGWMLLLDLCMLAVLVRSIRCPIAKSKRDLSL
jgi:hypothetical protein